MPGMIQPHKRCEMRPMPVRCYQASLQQSACSSLMSVNITNLALCTSCRNSFPMNTFNVELVRIN
eukprot:1159725-Pelagomonas_calceolata.AAC.10